MERVRYSHLTYDRGAAVITILSLPSGAAALAGVLTALASAGAGADMLTAWPAGAGALHVRFAVAVAQRQVVLAALATAQVPAGFAGVQVDDRVTRVELHGGGIRADAPAVARLHQALRQAGVAPLLTSISNTRLSLMCPDRLGRKAVETLRRLSGCTVRHTLIEAGGRLEPVALQASPR